MQILGISQKKRTVFVVDIINNFQYTTWTLICKEPEILFKISIKYNFGECLIFEFQYRVENSIYS